MDNTVKSRARYTSGRTMLLIIALFTTVNMMLVLLKIPIAFLLSLALPYEAAVGAGSGFLGLSPFWSVALCCVLPPLLFAALYFLSANDRAVFLYIGLALFAADTLYFFYSAFVNKNSSGFAVSAIFHLVVLFMLIGGSTAAAQIKRTKAVSSPAPSVSSGDDAPDVAESAEENEAEAAESGSSSRTYVYERQFAQANKADKTASMAAVVLGFFIIQFGWVAVVIRLIDLEDMITALLVAFAPLPILSVLLAILVTRLSHFINAGAFSYTVDEKGFVSREKTVVFSRRTEYLGKLSLLSKSGDRFVDSCQRDGVKAKKLLIPNAYPGFDEYLDGLSQTAD